MLVYQLFCFEEDLPFYVMYTLSMVEIDIPHGPCAIIQTTSMQDMAKKDLSILGCKDTIQFIPLCLLIENKKGCGSFSPFY